MHTNKKNKITMSEDGPVQQEGFALMVAVFDVHNEVGGGLAEEDYHESLEVEMEMRSMMFVSKQEIAIYYKGLELKRRYVPDLFVCDGIVVELKTVSQLLPEHDAQLFNYMQLTGKRAGYLINFAPLKRVEWRRHVL